MNTALMVILGVVSLVIIIAVMLQSDSGNGASALGGATTAVAKKAKGYEALLNKVTIIASVVFAVLVIVLVVLK